MNNMHKLQKYLTWFRVIARGQKSIVLLAILSCCFNLSASTQDLLKLEAAESISYVSQQVAKAYFYQKQGIQVIEAKKNIASGMSALRKDIALLEKNSVDEEEKNMVLFISFTADDMKEIIDSKYSEVNGALILDFSESLLEGAGLIANKHKKKGNKVEEELILVEEMSFLLERIAKFYIAYKSGFNDLNNVRQLQRAVANFQTHLDKLNTHKNYPQNLKTELMKINKIWPISKSFYLAARKSDLPIIVFNTAARLERSLHVIEKFHHTKALKQQKN